MYLSRLRLELYARQVRRDVADPYQLHRTLSRAFPGSADGGPGRVLFRVEVDPTTEGAVVLVQSDKQPEWANLPDDYASVEVKPFDPSFTVGQPLVFRLRASPSRKIGTTLKTDRLAGKPKSNGRRVGLLHEEEQRDWLSRKADEGGFRLLDVTVTREQLDLRGQFLRVGKREHAISLVVVRFDGLLAVTDPERFHSTLRAGVGAAKGFGFGLLSLAPAGG